MTTFEASTSQLPNVASFNKKYAGTFHLYQKLISADEDTYNFIYIDETKRDGRSNEELLANPAHPAVLAYCRTAYFRLYDKFVKSII